MVTEINLSVVTSRVDGQHSLRTDLLHPVFVLNGFIYGEVVARCNRQASKDNRDNIILPSHCGSIEIKVCSYIEDVAPLP